MSTRLLLVRHGQIAANLEHRWHGSTDVGTAVAWASCDSAATADVDGASDALAGASDTVEGEALAAEVHAATPRIDAATSVRSPRVAFRLGLVIRWSPRHRRRSRGMPSR